MNPSNQSRSHFDFVASCIHPPVGIDPTSKKTAPTFAGSCILIDPEGHLVESVPIPFAGHSVIQNPTSPSSSVVIIKWGPHACSIDWQEKKVARIFNALQGHIFFGHGCFVPDQSFFVTTETATNDLGSLVLRDSDSFEVVRIFSSYGICPHEVLYDSKSNSLYVANGGGYPPFEERQDSQNGFSRKPSLVQIDLASGELIRRFDFSTDSGPSHIRNYKEDFFLYGGGKDRNIFFAKIRGDGSSQLADTISLGTGVYLSSAIIDNEIFFSNPLSGRIDRWNLDQMEFLESRYIGKPTGLNVGFRVASELWSTDNLSSKIVKNPMENRTELPLSLPQGMVFGSHLTKFQIF